MIERAIIVAIRRVSIFKRLLMVVSCFSKKSGDRPPMIESIGSVRRARCAGEHNNADFARSRLALVCSSAGALAWGLDGWFGSGAAVPDRDRCVGFTSMSGPTGRPLLWRDDSERGGFSRFGPR
jgi:hypothetical protein